MNILDPLTASAEDLAAEVANTPGTARCQGCGSLTDPDVCHCGTSKASHRHMEDHDFVTIGCDCFRADGESRAARKAWRARGINVSGEETQSFDARRVIEAMAEMTRRIEQNSKEGKS